MAKVCVKKALKLTENKTEGVAPINLIVENEFHRATPGGTGTIGNYAAISRGGFHLAIFSLLRIMSSLLLKLKEPSCLELPGKVLSKWLLARSQGLKVEERGVTVDELVDADEVFCTGTAVVLSPVGSITYKSKRFSFGEGGFGTVSKQLYTALTNLQMGLSEDNMNWTVQLT